MGPPIGITICRSDGVPTYVSNGQTVVNGPKIGPDTIGRVYQKLESDDAKEYDWRKKLGAALMLAIEPDKHKNGTDKEYILKNLPDGYTLWVHSTSEGGSHTQKKKSRSDAYLYGHPFGHTKRFRSANEFAPHLVWLATGRVGDSDTCICVLCKPKEKSTGKTTESEATKPAQAPVQSDPTPTREQLLDSDPSVPYIYRPGELVWFNKGTAWGLAVICKRQMINSIPTYHLQPLSHPIRHCPAVAKSQEDLRPWLAWTLPRTTHPQIANLKYDAVPWERVLNGEFGPGDTEVDGSILAGKEINDSYTPLIPLGRKTSNPNEVHYGGMFLGAEKIWVGEAVRLQAPNNNNNETIVMVIEAIIEDGSATTKTASSTSIIGDIYAFVQVHLPPIYNDRKNWPTPRLPPRMAADLQWRNENSFERRRNIWSEWQLKESKAKRGLSAIKGRWYESRRLLPILRPDEFEKEVAAGETYDAGVWMNSRFDAVNDSLSRKPRLEAFGRAVPKDLIISLEPDESSGSSSKSSYEKSDFQFGNPMMSDSQYGSMGLKSEEVGDHSMAVDLPAGQQDFYSDTMQHQE